MEEARLEMGLGVPEAQPQEKKGIPGSTVKIIAVIAMLIDHAAAAVLARYLVEGINQASATGTVAIWLHEKAALYTLYSVMRAIGRLGFPIFCFLLVEGYLRTRSVKKYALRLGLFALISDVPFDLAICGQTFNFEYQNVYFTLLLGLLALWAYGFFGKYGRQGEKDLPLALRIGLMGTGVGLPLVFAVFGMREYSEAKDIILTCVILCAVIVTGLIIYGTRKGLRSVQTACADLTALTLCMAAAELLKTDYAGMGVLTITAMYLFRKRKAVSMLAGCIVLTIMSVSEVPAFLAIIPIVLYNGKRGLKMKYFFYAFYPAHLLLLYLAAVLFGLGSVSLL